jgi:mRNA-degrading endonuclease RelE of RelBE toxin-antitoxin system
MYILHITVQARKDLAFLKKNGGKAVTNKIEKLLIELMEHPRGSHCRQANSSKNLTFSFAI